jgi:hypothetical protein
MGYSSPSLNQIARHNGILSGCDLIFTFFCHHCHSLLLSRYKPDVVCGRVTIQLACWDILHESDKTGRVEFLIRLEIERSEFPHSGILHCDYKKWFCSFQNEFSLQRNKRDDVQSDLTRAWS